MAVSSTGKTNPNVDMSTWRKPKVGRRIKFDDDRKAKFLMCLLEHGKKILAAKQCDIHHATYMDHLRNDPEFEDKVNEVIEQRGANLIKQLESEQKPFDEKVGELREKLDND